MKILSWNILHGGGTRVRDILDVIASHQPDTVCLQEFRHGKSRQPLVDGLAKQGLIHAHSQEPDSHVKNTVAVFSRHEFSASTLVAGDSNSARAVQMQFSSTDEPPLRIIAVSFPHKKEQIPVFEQLLDLPPDYLAGNSLIIGDFNCGIPFEDSETKSFYATHLFQALLKQGWVDCWRSRNRQARQYSWFSTQKGNGFRYDHALSSPTFNSHVSDVQYDHQAREQKCSDHSALIVAG